MSPHFLHLDPNYKLSTSVISLFTTAMLIESFFLLFSFSPTRSALGDAFFTFLPVIISAVVLSFLKMFYVDSALSDEGHVLHRKVLIDGAVSRLWDFAILYSYHTVLIPYCTHTILYSYHTVLIP
jgi:hypothetical protein